MPSSLFELVNEALNDPGTNQNAALPDISSDVRNFLGKLSMLDGVPLYNLIPNERYIPKTTTTIVADNTNVLVEQGSLKIFWLDTEWIECLLDGALSVGDDQSTRNLLLSNALSGQYVAEVFYNRSKEQIKKQIRGLYNPEDFKTEFEARLNDKNINFDEKNKEGGILSPIPTVAQTNWCYTGFIMRSVLIASWPGIEVIAQGCDIDNKGNASTEVRALQVVKFERIDIDTILCICEGKISCITIIQPAEAIHFDLDEKEDGTQVEYTKQNIDIKVDENGIIDINALKTGMNITTAAAFANAMLARPVKLDIDITWIEEKLNA